MRNVLRSHEEVAHVWASQSQESGRAGNMFFEGPSIFSYGHHFEIARQVSGVVLFNDDRYSISTAKHQSLTRRAVSHLTIFDVPSMTDHNANVDAYIKLVASQTEKGKRAHGNKIYYFQDVVRWSNEARAYVAKFKKHITVDRRKAAKRLPADVFGILNKKEWAHVADLAQGQALREEAEKLKCAARYAVIEARRREETAALNIWGADIEAMTIQAWMSGAELPRGYSYDDELPTLLRIKDDEIQTTRGAYVPIKDAKILWRKMRAGEEIRGFKIGYYEVSGIHDGKLVIGCHRIPVREVVRMAGVLGLGA